MSVLKRLPLGPLVGRMGDDLVALRVGVSAETVRQRRRTGLSLREADEWATKLQLHGALVWGEDWDEAVEDDPVVEGAVMLGKAPPRSGLLVEPNLFYRRVSGDLGMEKLPMLMSRGDQLLAAEAEMEDWERAAWREFADQGPHPVEAPTMVVVGFTDKGRPVMFQQEQEFLMVASVEGVDTEEDAELDRWRLRRGRARLSAEVHPESEEDVVLVMHDDEVAAMWIPALGVLLMQPDSE